MKAINRYDFWKAIAFLVLSLSLSSCFDSCNEPALKAVVTISPAENITSSSATLVALVTPNQDNAVIFFEYQPIGSATWQTAPVDTKYSGMEAVKVTLDVNKLQPDMLYKYRATAGGVTSTVGTFTTLPDFVVRLSPATEIKGTTAKLNAVLIIQSDVTIAWEYQRLGDATWTSFTLPLKFSGADSIRINFNISDLVLNTTYNFRLKVNEIPSESSSFKTCAVSDFDGNWYHTVTIGNQTWLQENFKGTHFANGDIIPNVTDQTAWDNLVTPGYCYYNNDSKNGETYGALYNFYVASDSRGLIVGYHTPSHDEFIVLSDYLGGYNVAGGKMKESGYEHWIKPNTGATNSSGFTGLPSGARRNGSFGHMGDGIGFWTETQFGIVNVAFAVSLGENSAVMQLYGGYYHFSAFSIRVVKN